MRWKLFPLVLFTLQRYTQQSMEVQELEIDEPMVEALCKMIRILARFKIAVWYNAGKGDLVSELLKRVDVPFVLNAVERPKTRGLETRTGCDVVVILSGLNVERVVNETLWYRDTRFLVVADVGDVDEDLKNFWRYKIINIFELVKTEEDVDVYSFLPYEKTKCDSITVKIVDTYQSKEGGFTSNGTSFYDTTRIKNMNGCRVNITVVDVKPNVMFYDECNCNATTHVRGIEGNLLTEVSKRFNFNATFVIALDGIGWGWIHPAPHGAVGEVFTGRSDFAIGLLAPTLERYESLDISLPYNGEECITYGVPTGAGASTPGWITILTSEFSPVIWLLIFFSFFSVALFFELVNKHLPGHWLSTKTDVILFVFSSCLGLPVKIPKYLLLRLSLAIWILVSFIVTVAYRSSMGSKLTVPNRDPDINTFQELLDSNLEFTGYNNMLRLLQFNDRDLIVQKMMDRFKVTNFDIDYAVDRIAAERKIAYIRHTTTFLYYALINPKAKGHIHVIKDCLYMYHPMVVTKKHSPFSNRLNQLISRLMESGITRKWRSDYIYNFPTPPKPFLKLSNDHMYGVFCILCLGYALGIFSFLIEIIYFRCRGSM